MKHAAAGVSILLCALAALPACTRDSGPAAESLPVVVYAAYDDKDYLPGLFNDFTRSSGIPVVVRNAEVPGIVDDVLQNRVSPAADILLTPAVSDIWPVAEQGQLRPDYSAEINDKVPAWLRDPDKFWVALGYRHAIILFDPRQLTADDLGNYEALAAPQFRRKLCLTSSALAINRSVIAMLIHRLGRRDAELTVRSWVANLAEPPFEDEQQLLRNLESGVCAVAIASSSYSSVPPGARLAAVLPTPAASTAEAIGITRHARNAKGAEALIDWLLRAEIQQAHAAAMSMRPVSAGPIGAMTQAQLAAADEEARLLAERARYH